VEDEEGGTRKEEEQPLGGGVGSAIGRNLGKKKHLDSSCQHPTRSRSLANSQPGNHTDQNKNVRIIIIKNMNGLSCQNQTTYHSIKLKKKILRTQTPN
jgi:hypothetical protein